MCDFIAIDVETANPDMASICQIGIACFEGGVLAEQWVSYVDPQDYFDPMNIVVHGITEGDVAEAPTFPAVMREIAPILNDGIVVCHTHFDRVAFRQAAERFGATMPPVTWLDSARVTRRTWEQFRRRGYGLHSVCAMLGYEFRHHDALEDAKAAGHILLAAIRETGLSVDQWLKRVQQPIDPNAPRHSKSSPPIRREGNPEGDLYGEVLVFTGALALPRREAADMAATIGCQVASGVTKKTTLLVVGDQDVTKLAGHEKSSKHRKAEKLISEGQNIRILRETDFISLAQPI
jgi:DNA polymerase-3 subunit epsilon